VRDQNRGVGEDLEVTGNRRDIISQVPGRQDSQATFSPLLVLLPLLFPSLLLPLLVPEQDGQQGLFWWTLLPRLWLFLSVLQTLKGKSERLQYQGQPHTHLEWGGTIRPSLKKIRH